MSRVSEAERSHLNSLFAELCAIRSPFGEERPCAERVAAYLRSDLGLVVDEDDAADRTGANCGNLLARIPGPEGARSVLLCSHVDTVGVPADRSVEPVLEGGVWRSAGDTILGADNKAAIAVMLVAARRALADGAPVGIELLFTVSEEDALAGAKAFDVTRLRSGFGYVFDHASAIGEVIVASPTYHRITADFHGRAAHAGLAPENGRSAILAAAQAISAMELGRLDRDTTANVGTIEGGSGSTNVVPERCRVMAEARSLEIDKVEAQVAHMVECVQDGAAHAECDVDLTVERLFEGYRQRPSLPAIVAAEAALRRCGVEPSRVVTGGASDANAFEAAGFECVNLANGTERNHQSDEAVSAASLELMLDVTLALLEEAAAC